MPLANSQITWRPLTAWPADRTRTLSRQPSPFSAGMTDTEATLRRELGAVGARAVVIQVDVKFEAKLRREGRPYVDTQTNTPAVVVTFEKNFGTIVRPDWRPVTFACDRFTRWHDNLRAIALGMSDLRRVERYHIAASGAQYRGYTALPASTTAPIGTETAAAILAKFSLNHAAAIRLDPAIAKSAARTARAKTHPDAGGSTTDFTLVQEAARVLGAHHNTTL